MATEDYPDQDPALPDIPGVLVRYSDLEEVHHWQAWQLLNGGESGARMIFHSPWKKLTWKMAKKHMEAMG